MRTLWIAVALAMASGGCKKTEEEPGGAGALPPVDSLSQSEADLGRKACSAYVAQVCGCVEKQPDLKEECEMARARPEAFEMNTRASLAEGDASGKDRRILIANSRKIMRACIEDAAALVKKGCSPPAAPAPAPGE
ncbi:MAG TPA: hypothetical protein VIG06_20640 [Kofleriaceae bacterium]